MRPPLTLMALAGTLVAPIALAQVPSTTPRPQGSGASSPMGATGGPRPVGNVPPLTPADPASTPSQGGANANANAPAPTDRQVFRSEATLPAPTPPDQIPAATVKLPNDPIEPYLLTREVGPFLVMAKTFKGPDAERWALALVLELRNDYKLPAYILRYRDFPMRSNIRGVPPTAIREQPRSMLVEPEKARTLDEAVVLVGNEKTLKDSEVLLRRVKKIKPKCLNGMPSIFHWRQGLSQALRTTNPYVPAQDLYPSKGDPLVKQMNAGPHTVMHCPGQYSMQVAEFSGRSTFNVDDASVADTFSKRSPLATAAVDAEKLADMLARDPEVQKTGYQPYVFHDRTSSRVYMGAFNMPNDPNAARLYQELLRVAVPLSEKSNKEKSNLPMMVPVPALTDVQGLKTQAQ